MSKCRYDLSEDCNNIDCLTCVLDKIIAEIDKLNPVDYVSMGSYEGHKGAGDMKHDVLRIIDKYKEESEDKCSNCAKSWTDDCPRDKCWDNNYSEFVEESEINEWQK